MDGSLEIPDERMDGRTDGQAWFIRSPPMNRVTKTVRTLRTPKNMCTQIKANCVPGEYADFA